MISALLSLTKIPALFLIDNDFCIIECGRGGDIRRTDTQADKQTDRESHRYPLPPTNAHMENIYRRSVPPLALMYICYVEPSTKNK